MFDDILKEMEETNKQVKDMRNKRDEILARIQRRHMEANAYIKDAMKDIQENGRKIAAISKKMEKQDTQFVTNLAEIKAMLDKM